MPVDKGRHFAERDIYIDYPFEQVMFRWDHRTETLHKKFYGRMESPNPVPQDNHLFNEALLYGDEISQEQYLAGAPRRQ